MRWLLRLLFGSRKRCLLHGPYTTALCPPCGRMRARFIEGGD